MRMKAGAKAEAARFEAVLQGGLRRAADEAAVALRGFRGAVAARGEGEGEGGKEDEMFFHGVRGFGG